jgi:hypothetical protein
MPTRMFRAARREGLSGLSTVAVECSYALSLRSGGELAMSATAGQLPERALGEGPASVSAPIRNQL